MAGCCGMTTGILLYLVLYAILLNAKSQSVAMGFSIFFALFGGIIFGNVLWVITSETYYEKCRCEDCCPCCEEEEY